MFSIRWPAGRPMFVAFARASIAVRPRAAVLSVPAIARLAAGGIAVGALASATHAQWTVIDLHPAGQAASVAYGVSGGQQAGIAWNDSRFPNAYLWTGTAAAAVNLNSSRSTSAYCVDGGVQGGYIDLITEFHACLWTGTPGSLVDLNPGATGAITSNVWGIDGGMAHQVGHIYHDFGGPDFHFHAGRWTGSAASWVDLNPAGVDDSDARAVHAGQQVGSTWVFGAPQDSHAALWTGTAASWVDLHPPGSALQINSAAYGVHSGQQVGSITGPSGAGIHAVLWTGTAASWVDLHPPASLACCSSVAQGVHGGQQVGGITVGGAYRACLWSGSAASIVDLHALLPAGSVGSMAYGIWHDATHTYVVGNYGMAGFGGLHSVMWVGPPGPCFPLSGPSNTPACPGGTATLSVVATGAGGPFTYQWRFNSVPISTVSNPSAATATLVLSTLSGADAGPYNCVVTGACGSITSGAAALTLNSPPVITFQPYAATTCPSGTAYFSITGAGAGPITYLWQHETAPASGTWFALADGATGGLGTISGVTTSFLAISNFGPLAPGAYRCIVSNACGSTTSSAATLTVCPADYDCDGQIAPADVSLFVTTWFTSLTDGTLAGDFDHNGAVEPADVSLFVTTWFTALSTGC